MEYVEFLVGIQNNGWLTCVKGRTVEAVKPGLKKGGFY